MGKFVVILVAFLAVGIVQAQRYNYGAHSGSNNGGNNGNAGGGGAGSDGAAADTRVRSGNACRNPGVWAEGENKGERCVCAMRSRRTKRHHGNRYSSGRYGGYRYGNRGWYGSGYYYGGRYNNPMEWHCGNGMTK